MSLRLLSFVIHFCILSISSCHHLIFLRSSKTMSNRILWHNGVLLLLYLFHLDIFCFGYTTDSLVKTDGHNSVTFCSDLLLYWRAIVMSLWCLLLLLQFSPFVRACITVRTKIFSFSSTFARFVAGLATFLSTNTSCRILLVTLCILGTSYCIRLILIAQCAVLTTDFVNWKWHLLLAFSWVWSRFLLLDSVSFAIRSLIWDCKIFRISSISPPAILDSWRSIFFWSSQLLLRSLWASQYGRIFIGHLHIFCFSTKLTDLWLRSLLLFLPISSTFSNTDTTLTKTSIATISSGCRVCAIVRPSKIWHYTLTMVLRLEREVLEFWRR